MRHHRPWALALYNPQPNIIGRYADRYEADRVCRWFARRANKLNVAVMFDPYEQS